MFQVEKQIIKSPRNKIKKCTFVGTAWGLGDLGHVWEELDKCLDPGRH